MRDELLLPEPLFRLADRGAITIILGATLSVTADQHTFSFSLSSQSKVSQFQPSFKYFFNYFFSSFPQLLSSLQVLLLCRSLVILPFLLCRVVFSLSSLCNSWSACPRLTITKTNSSIDSIIYVSQSFLLLPSVLLFLCTISRSIF